MVEAEYTAPGPAELMALLAEIGRQSRESARREPQALADDDVWDGLAFSIAGVRLVSAMNEIREMMAYPAQLTPVPGARKWMKGLANVRGSLLPVVDLQLYFGAKAVVRGKAARMLIVRLREVECGLLVPSVQGMRHFSEELRMKNARMQGTLGRYVYDAFSVDGELWPVFSMSGLTADPDFRSAAI